MRPERVNDVLHDEAGFSLVEVIVAMMLLAMVALLTVPFFALSLRQTTSTSTRTSATAKVQDVLEQAHAPAAGKPVPTCATLNAIPKTQGPYADAQGRPFSVNVAMSPASCTSTNALVRVTVTAASGSTTLATATTEVYVP